MRIVSVGMRLGFASFCVVLPLGDGATLSALLGLLGMSFDGWTAGQDCLGLRVIIG
jgi:hypothetical protein